MKTKRIFKILMIAPTPFFADRGCHVRIYEETKTLQKLGHKIIICTYHLGNDIEGIDIRRICNIPWYKKLSAGPSWHKFYLDALLFFKCLITAWKEKSNIIHANLHEGMFIAMLLKFFIRLPVLFDFQGSMTEECIDHGFFKKGSFLYKAFKFVEEIIIKQADIVIPSNILSANSIKNEFGINGRKVFLLKDACDTEQYFPCKNKERIRRKYEIPLNKKVIVFLGVLSKYQGIDCLLQAAALLVKERKDVFFAIGGFPKVDYYRKMAEDLGISGFVIFPGRISYLDAPEFLSCADIGVGPKISLTEGNQKLCSYMSCGLVTVAFDSQINRDIVADAGLYADFGSPLSLAEVLLRAIKDESLSKNLSNKAREHALKNFSWYGVAEQIGDLYENLVDREMSFGRRN